MSEAGSDQRWIVDVGDAEFDREVVARSSQVPVVVDFHAEWCGPCKQLGPLLERLTREHAGEFILARVDVDAAPAVSGRLGIQSIPTVIGFRDGAPQDAFQGALPEAEVRRFLAELLPGVADELVEEAKTFAAAGRRDAARDRLEAALAAHPRHPGALLARARLSADAGDTEAALADLADVSPDAREAEDAQRLAARLRLYREGAGEDLAELEDRVSRSPEDLGARLALGRALCAAGQFEAALETLLVSVERDPDHDDQAARRAMVDVFEVLGPRHEVTQRFRAALARTLFR